MVKLRLLAPAERSFPLVTMIVPPEEQYLNALQYPDPEASHTTLRWEDVHPEGGADVVVGSDAGVDPTPAACEA